MWRKVVVGRGQTENVQVSPYIQMKIVWEVAYSLCTAGRETEVGELSKENIENCDKTNFQTNSDNEKKLRFRGDKKV